MIDLENKQHEIFECTVEYEEAKHILPLKDIHVFLTRSRQRSD